MTDLDPVRGGVVPGLLLVVVDAGVGWLLYDAVAPAVGFGLWLLAALVVAGLLLDGVGRGPRFVGPQSDAPIRE